MSNAPEQNHNGPGRPKPGPLFVIPPRSMIRDELRVARLELFLEAEFPGLSFVMAEDAKLAGDRGSVGVRPPADGSDPLSSEDARTLIGQVLDAVALFVDYGQRVH